MEIKLLSTGELEITTSIPGEIFALGQLARGIKARHPNSRPESSVSQGILTLCVPAEHVVLLAATR